MLSQNSIHSEFTKHEACGRADMQSGVIECCKVGVHFAHSHAYAPHLVAEDVIVHVVLLGRLRGQHEGLREAPHGGSAVGQLARHLHHHSVAQRGLSVHLHTITIYMTSLPTLGRALRDGHSEGKELKIEKYSTTRLSIDIETG